MSRKVRMSRRLQRLQGLVDGLRKQLPDTAEPSMTMTYMHETVTSNNGKIVSYESEASITNTLSDGTEITVSTKNGSRERSR